MHALCRGRYSIQVAQGSSAKFAKMNKSPEQSTSTHSKTQACPRPPRLHSVDTEVSRSTQYQFDHPKTFKPGARQKILLVHRKKFASRKRVHCLAWGNASEGERNKENYSEPVVPACFSNTLKKVPDFVGLQSIAIHSRASPRTQDVVQCTLPFSNGNSPDKNKDFQISSQPQIREGYLGQKNAEQNVE